MMFSKNKITKLLILLAFVGAFVGIGLYGYLVLVKNNSFKPIQFQNDSIR